MNIIAAADNNWGIGKDGQLLDHISEDMKYFKEKTLNCAVIMGKNTFLSLPGQKPLSERMNIVLTHDPEFKADGIEACSSIEDAIITARKRFDDDKIYFIGGESVYKSAVEYCNTAYITKIDNEYEADRYIIDFDSLKDWSKSSEEMIKTKKGLYITFTVYKKI